MEALSEIDDSANKLKNIESLPFPFFISEWIACKNFVFHNNPCLFCKQFFAKKYYSSDSTRIEKAFSLAARSKSMQ